MKFQRGKAISVATAEMGRAIRKRRA